MGQSNTANGGTSYFNLDIQTVSADADTYVLRAVIYLTSLNVVDTNNTLAVSGNWSRGGALGINGVYNHVPVWFEDIAIGRAIGADQTITVAASWSSVEYWGTTLSASEAYVVPGKVSVPNPPNVGVDAVTATTAHLISSGNGDNGSPADLVNYRIHRVSDGAHMGDLTGGYAGVTFPGLFRATAYDAYAQAHNGAGWSGWSGAARFTTSATVPVAPPAPTVDQITSTGARVVVGAPADNGGANLGPYRIHIATDAAFTTLVKDASSMSGTLGFSGLSPNTAYWARAAASNTVGQGPFSASTPFTTTPSFPAQPTGPSVARVSDTTHTVTWTNNPTTAAPYDTVAVQRGTDGGAYATIATVAGTAATYSDTTTTANHTYKYRVSAQNSTGSAVSTTAVTIATTPAPPTSPAVARGSGVTAVVTWGNDGTNPAYSTTITETDGAGGWGAVKATLASGITTWTDNTPRAGTTQYRLAHVSTGNVIGLTSAYVTTNTLSVIAPPNAPSGLSPNGIAVPAGPTAVVLAWVHNPVDGSAQRQYQLQYREVGAGTWTTGAVVTSAVSSAAVSGVFVNGKNYEWAVKTWGTDATASPLSATATFTASTPPTATIDTPATGSTYGTSTLSVTWGYFDAESTPQAQWRATLALWPETTVVETLTAANTATTATFATKVTNGRQYRVTVEVQDSSGLWSAPGASTFTVTYLPPEIVTLDAVWHRDTGVISLLLTPQGPVAGVSVAAVSVTIDRSIDGGATWERVATDVPPNASVIDTSPTVAGTNLYRLTIVSATPSTLVINPADSVTVAEPDNGYLSGGPGFATVAIVACDLVTSTATGRAKALYHFAGRAKPVEFAGTATDHAVSVKGTVTGDPTTGALMEEFARGAGVVLWRDPSGRRVFGSLGPVQAAQVHMAAPHVWETSFTVTEVDY